MHMNRLALATVALFAVLCHSALASAPIVGQSAPPLTFTDLLQAPAGVKADWPSLRGKVVVLEFWATWCVGCVEEIPHINDLIQSLDANRVQFIAVDDEESAVVKKFLAKTPIKGWVALDTSKKIIDAYDAKIRPRTVVVDPQGRIAAIISPEQLTKKQLLTLADGKPVVFPVDETAEIRQQALKQAEAAANMTKTDSQAIFDISIRPGNPTGQTTMVHHPGQNGDSFTYDVLNAPLSMLLQYAAGIAGSRLTIHGDKDEKYSLHVAAPGGKIVDLAPAIQLAILTTTGRKLIHVTALEDAYVLQAAPKAASHQTPVGADQMSFCFYDSLDHKVMMMNANLDELASALEDAIGAPVVNEVGIRGSFSANFDLPQGDVETAKAALQEKLGLTLVKAKRNIERFVLEAPTAKKDMGEKAVSDKTAPKP